MILQDEIRDNFGENLNFQFNTYITSPQQQHLSDMNFAHTFSAQSLSPVLHVHRRCSMKLKNYYLKLMKLNYFKIIDVSAKDG